MNDLKIIDLYDNSSDAKRKDFLKTNKSKLEINHNFEKQILDLSWLEKIENNIHYVDNILRNPNRFIVNEEEVVKIELARRITSESIKHLAKHTNFIQDIDRDGSVHPAKILNINKEESFNTYENRVIYTLVKNLMTYMELKKKSLRLGIPNKNDKILNYEGKARIGNENVTISLNLNTYLDDKDEAQELEDRIQKVEFQIKELTNSEVYKSIERAHVALVYPPIKKTNLILKNTNFQHAMTLYYFLQEEMKDNADVEKGNEKITENKKILDLLNESFLLNYFVLNSLDDQENLKDEEKIKKTKTILINNLLQKIVLSNEELNINEIEDMVNKQFQLIKKQTLITEKEIREILAVAIDEYTAIIKEVRIEDLNEKNKR